MLEYALTEEFIKFLASLDNKERGEMLWECQRFLSHCPGYLTHKKEDLDETTFIYSYKDEIFYKVTDYFNLRTLIAGAKKGQESSLKGIQGTILVKESIVSLLKEDKGNHYQDDLAKFLKANYFTKWFTRLLDELPSDARSLFAPKKETALAPKEATPIQEKVVVKPIVQPSPVVLTTPKVTVTAPKEVHHPKEDVDGLEYEKAILAELQEAYEKRQAAKKKVATAPLHHVRFAPIEEVISYKNESECLDLLLKRTRKFSCHNSENDWLIILANTVDGSFAKEIESRYPDHVVYTDEPNKGNLRLAIIVKRNRVDSSSEENEDAGVKRMHSKEASFAPTMPKGAYENIEQEDEDEEARPRSDYGDYSVRRVKSKEATFKPVIAPINVEEDDGFEDLGEDDGPINEMNWDATPAAPNERDQEPVVPKYWHCYLCGKRKIHSGEPAETITLRDGKIAYLCKKHRGKM
jgi:hypothetical protein